MSKCVNASTCKGSQIIGYAGSGEWRNCCGGWQGEADEVAYFVAEYTDEDSVGGGVGSAGYAGA